MPVIASQTDEQNWLTSLQAAKDECRAEGTGDDDWFEIAIGGVSGAIETYCDRHFNSQSFNEYYDGNGRDKLTLNQFPISEVASCTLDDEALDVADTDEFVVYGAEGIICIPYSTFTRGYENVHVQYTAGYSPVPDEIERACLKWIALEYAFRKENRIGVDNRGGNVAGSVSFRHDEIPPEIRMVLDKYVKVR